MELSESPAADREVGASEPCLSRTGHQLAGIYPRADNQHRVMLESVSGGDKTSHRAPEWCPIYPMTSGPMVGGAVATLRMKEVQGAGRGNVKSKSRSRGN